jgi:hypothetical protein
MSLANDRVHFVLAALYTSNSMKLSQQELEQQPGAGDLLTHLQDQQRRVSLAALDRALRLAAGTWLEQMEAGQDILYLLPSLSSAHSLLQQLPPDQQLPVLTTLLQAVGCGIAQGISNPDAGTCHRR